MFTNFHVVSPAPETIVMYGDSETQLNNWTAALQADVGPGYKIVNTALAGQDSDWGMANLETNVLACHPSIVVFEFSMNDAVRLTLSEAKSNTISIIERIEAADPGAQIFLATNNEPSAAAVASSQMLVPGSNLANVDAYYQQYRDIAHEMHIGLIDNEPLWQKAQAADSTIVPDGYHPTLAADMLYEVPTVLAALGIRPNHGLVTPHEFAL